MKNRNFLILGIIFLIGIFLRMMYLSQGGLTFDYDQGRDAFVVLQLLHGDLKIQGPPASIPGLYHGVLYYYLIAPAYFVGHGSPVIVAVWMAIINSLGVIIAYILGREFFKNNLAGLLAALFFAVSFEQTQYATWLSNPAFAAVTVPLFYLNLWHWYKQKKWGAFLAGVFLGVSIQAEIFLAYHFFVLLILIFIKKIRINWSTMSKFTLGLLLATTSMLVSEIKFGFLAVSGLRNLFFNQGGNLFAKPFSESLLVYADQFARLFSFNIFPLNQMYAGLVGILVMIWALKQTKAEWKTFLILYIFASIFGSAFGGSGTPFINVGLGMAAILLIARFLQQKFSSSKPLVISIILIFLVTNLYQIFSENKDGQTIFAVQKDRNLKNELSAIDYIYRTSNGPFSINSITNPLYINTSWSYLFNWYGKSRYGYLPFWHGHDQIGSLGNNLQRPPKEVNKYFLIIEPPQANFSRWIQPGIEEEDGKSTLIDTHEFGQIIVQTRKPK